MRYRKNGRDKPELTEHESSEVTQDKTSKKGPQGPFLLVKD